MRNQRNTFHIVIGIGNPEEQYQDTYHNVGALFIDTLQHNVRKKDYNIYTSNVYMNQSGKYVKEILKKHHATPDELLIVHDDSDIELGMIKISYDRGSAGHKGVQNIIDQIKTKSFWRLRIGIRPPQKIREKAETFVLKKISSTNKKVFEKIFVKTIKDIFNTTT